MRRSRGRVLIRYSDTFGQIGEIIARDECSVWLRFPSGREVYFLRGEVRLGGRKRDSGQIWPGVSLALALVAVAVIVALTLASCAHPADSRPRHYSANSGSGSL